MGPIAKYHRDHTTLEFVLVDTDGNDGFPGDLETTVKYTIKEDSLEIEYISSLAEGSKRSVTAVNLTNHSYWNISPNKDINGTRIRASTNKCLKVNPKSLLPTGEIIESPHDLTKTVELTPDISFDNCFIANEKGSSLDTRSNELIDVVEATHPSSKTKLSVATTDPAFQLYTGDYTDINDFKSRSGFCVESSRFINAVNNKEWAEQVVLRKGETYGSKLKFSLSSVTT